MKLKLLIGCCIGLFVAACSEPDAEKEKAKYLRAKKSATNVEFTDPRLAKTVVGFRATNISVVYGPDDAAGGGNEQSGNAQQLKASCKIEGNGYAATFAAPAIVNLPSFGTKDALAKLTCTYNEKTFTETYKPVNFSSGSRAGTGVVVGILLCPICGAAMAGAGSNDKDGDAYAFEDIVLNVK